MMSEFFILLVLFFWERIFETLKTLTKIRTVNLDHLQDQAGLDSPVIEDYKLESMILTRALLSLILTPYKIENSKWSIV